MGEWGYLGGLFDSLQLHSPMLGRFWLLIMLVFRILILGTVASDLFEDEQEEFACNTLQPGCKQVCYDMAFPISQYRFWVFRIVLIATPSLVFLMYAMHHNNKRDNSSRFNQKDIKYSRDDRHFRRFYIVNVAFRMLAEVGFLVGQWYLYGFKVEAQFPCNRFPCPYTVDCFTSRPAEKTVFLCFYFVVGVIAAISSCAELIYGSMKWFCKKHPAHDQERNCVCENLQNLKNDQAGADEKPQGKALSGSLPNSVRLKGGSMRSSASRKVSSIGHKPRCKYVSTKTLLV
ncbi:gap junction delta-3 protein-like [Tautogolabrus adspersus]